MAGEVSGDQLMASILAELRLKKKYNIFGCGGDKMKKQGLETLYHVREMEVVGFSEVISKYFRLRKYMNELIRQVKIRGVGDAFLVDYPGFNLRLAKRLSRLNVDCHFVVSPQLWAWNYKRIYKMKKWVKNVLCLYSFETKIYEKHGIPAHFIGHPLFQEMQTRAKEITANTNPVKKKNTGQKPPGKYVCLLPGSRRLEIERILPFMLRLCKTFQSQHKEFSFLLPCPTNKDLIKKIRSYTIPHRMKIRLMPGKVHEALAVSHAAIACSGTVTMECLFWRVPFLLLYRTSWFTHRLGRLLVQIPYLGMVNVLGGKFIHREFIQGDIKLHRVMPELVRIIFDEPYRNVMLKEFNAILKNMLQKNPAKKGASVVEGILSAGKRGNEP